MISGGPAAAIGLALCLTLPSGAVAAPADWRALDREAKALFAQGRYAEALTVSRRAVAAAEAALGREDEGTAFAANTLALTCTKAGLFDEAESLYRRVLATLERVKGKDDAAVALVESNFATLLAARGRYPEAESRLARALDIHRRSRGAESLDVALVENGLAELNRLQGRHREAEALWTHATKTMETALGPHDPQVGRVLGNVGLLLHDQGRYAEAEPVLRRSVAVLEKGRGADHPELVAPLTTLGGVLAALGRYAEVEALYRRALGIAEGRLGKEHLQTAQCLNLLADLLRVQGRTADALALARLALNIRERALGPEHRDVAVSLNNVAALLADRGAYAEAAPLLKRAAAILEKTLGPGHPLLAQTLSSSAEVQRNLGDYAQAEAATARAVPILERALGPAHPTLATALSNQGLILMEQGRFGDAEDELQRSLAVLRQTGAEQQFAAIAVTRNLGRLYFLWRKSPQAEAAYEQALASLARQFDHHFTYMSEKDRLTFVETVDGLFPEFFSFCVTFQQRNPALLGRMYDVLLWRKGFIGASLATLRRQVEASSDPAVRELFETITARRTELARLLMQEGGEAGAERVRQLEEEANALESELVRRAAPLKGRATPTRVTWRDVQAGLAPQEAAVEIARFQQHTWGLPTPRHRYVALVVTRATTTAPLLVDLGEAEELEGRALVDHRTRVLSRSLVHEAAPGPPGAAAALADVWRTLAAAFGGATRVYLSPDGSLNQVAWATVPLGDGRLVLDTCDLRLVSSTRDLAGMPAAAGARTAVLVGDASFGVAAPPDPAPTRDLRGLRAEPLPSTRQEVERIASLLRGQAWRVEVYTGPTARESAVKRVKGPRVLHVATHGYFLSDLEGLRGRPGAAAGRAPASPAAAVRADDPMLRSGLLFTGANATLAGAVAAEGGDDGVLTALEAMDLDLQGTELVVLSACETGVGEVRNGEGIFGLRRALAVAGAQRLLMSLWAVPDRETKELMARFYEGWLAGRDMHQAFREAQQAMRSVVRERYGQDLPFYWGAFVLVGR